MSLRRVSGVVGVLLASLAGTGDVQGQEVGVESAMWDRAPRRMEVDVLHYDLALELGAADTIAARAEILFEARAGIEEVALDFGDLVVDSVTVDGAPAAFRHAEGRLVVATPPTAAGARREIAVRYHGRPADGLVLRPNRHGTHAVFADNWADRARHWFPAVDHPSDKATAAFTVTAPAAWRVVANGYLVERVDLGNGRARTRWAETAEIPTYCMVVGATEFAVAGVGRAAGVEVTHWTFPADSADGAAAFARSIEILGFYDSLFGPYPYEKLAHVQSATKFGGMENASAIFYSEEAIGTALEEGAGTEGAARDGLTSLVAHETVHQWFGDAVTEADWTHLWLSEGFADYFAAVFFERNGSSTGRGAAELARRMAAMREDVLVSPQATTRAVVAPGPGPGEYERLLSPLSYEKGAWILHMLRREIGDVAFFEAVRTYYAELRDGVAWTADFERVAEEAAGRDLGWFFAQWAGRPGHPILAVETARGGDGTRVRLRQTQPGEPFRFTVDLALEGAEGTLRESVVMEGREAEIRVPGAVRSVTVDPEVSLLFAPADG